MTLGKSTGSGTIINSDGTILTCAHVVVGSKGYKPTSKGKVSGKKSFALLFFLTFKILNLCSLVHGISTLGAIP